METKSLKQTSTEIVYLRNPTPEAINHTLGSELTLQVTLGDPILLKSYVLVVFPDVYRNFAWNPKLLPFFIWMIETICLFKKHATKRIVTHKATLSAHLSTIQYCGEIKQAWSASYIMKEAQSSRDTI